jgi:hypothetical protein
VLALDGLTDEIYATATANGMRYAVAPVKQGLSDSLVEQLVEIIKFETARS